MVKKILRELKFSWMASTEWAESQSKIYSEMEISLKEAKIVKCQENYRNSQLGDIYISQGMPKFNDKQIIEYALSFYVDMYGKRLERLIVQKLEVDIEDLLGEIKEDADDFFKNYLLVRFISTIPTIILESFDNYSQAKSFVKRVNPKMTAKEVVQLYREISGRKSPNDNGGWPISSFVNEMNKMGICYLGDRSIQTEFAR